MPDADRRVPTAADVERWVVDIKGRPNDGAFEISVLRDGNTHGKRSYGWFGPEKLLISSSGGPCRDGVAEVVWCGLVATAHWVAAKMNGEDVGPVNPEPLPRPEGDPGLADLVERARHHVMTDDEREAQRESWARGEAELSRLEREERRTGMSEAE